MVPGGPRRRGEHPLRVPTLPALLLTVPLLVGIAAAQGHDHHPQTCTLLPELTAGNEFVWSQPKNAGHGGDVRDSAHVAGVLGSNDYVKQFVVGPDPRTRPVNVGDGVWRMSLAVQAVWVPDVPGTFPVEDVRMKIGAQPIASGHELSAGDAEVVLVRHGLVSQAGTPNLGAPLGSSAGLSRAHFTFGPHPGVKLDEIGIRFKIEIPDPAANPPGTVHYAVRLSFLLEDDHPGTFLIVPGACTSRENALPDHGHGHGHDDAAGDVHHHASAAPPGDEICHAVPGYCDSAPAAAPEAAPAAHGDPAAATTASPLAWGPAAVTATLGVAGAGLFRTHRP
jgi:hypothetical protein